MAIRATFTPVAALLVVAGTAAAHDAPSVAAFDAFSKRVKVTTDDRYLYIESDGLPDHPMMKGITNWQQQVPLPQPYSGANRWRVPLKPVPADRPISAKTNLFRGAIAVAVNGVPIFNPLNNRREDAFLAGELDEWGGHCGRADDYHYHIAPLHLEALVGKGRPIAYALDGYPVYGLTNADGSPAGPLDEFNGTVGPDGSYRYHATKTYPYVNGGLRGVVEVRDGQVDPQPRAFPVRPAGEPLRGATITDFVTLGEHQYRLAYRFRGQTRGIDYAANKDGTYTFRFDDGDGQPRTETYRREDDRGKGNGKVKGRGKGKGGLAIENASGVLFVVGVLFAGPAGLASLLTGFRRNLSRAALAAGLTLLGAAVVTMSWFQ